MAFPTSSSTESPAHDFHVQVFSKTAGYRHDSIPAGIEAIRQLGADHHFSVSATEDAAQFNDANLSQLGAIVFLHTTGDFLNAVEKAALQTYVRDGGGFVGIHGAADAGCNWPWYGELVGAYFKSHPAIQRAAVLCVDRTHPATSVLPARWVRTDEWYNFQTNPRGAVQVLATLDETTYSGGEMGTDHPVCWCREFDGGRSWYTALGHTIDSYDEPEFLAHLLGGIEWASRRMLSTVA